MATTMQDEDSVDGEASEFNFQSPPDAGFADAHGLETQIEKLQRAVVQPAAAEMDVDNGTVHFEGPEGSGKTWLAKATAGELAESGYTFCALSSYPDEDGELELYLQELVSQAKAHAPCIILFENFDTLVYRDEQTAADAIESCLDATESIFVFGELTDGHVHLDIPSAHLHVSLPEPDDERRLGLLSDSLARLSESSDVAFDRSAVDMEALADQLDWCPPSLYETLERRILFHAHDEGAERLTEDYIEAAIEEVRTEAENDPTVRVSVESDFPDESSHSVENRFEVEETSVSFDDIGGLDDVIAHIEELVQFPQAYPDLFAESNLQHTSGLLLHGPPGNGKTLLARALANETDRTYFSVRGPELKNKWFGQSEQYVRDLFEAADEHDPSLIFFDEFDAIAANRDGCSSTFDMSILNMLLSEMDGLEERGDILFLASTNRADALDPAVLRPGRIGKQIEITTPDADGRAEIFDIYLSDLPTGPEVTPSWCAEVASEDISGAEIEAVCRNALYAAIRNGEDDVTITSADIEKATETTENAVQDC